MKRRQDEFDDLLTRQLKTEPQTLSEESRQHILNALARGYESAAEPIETRPRSEIENMSWVAAGLLLAAILLSAVVWRNGPPYSVAVNTGNANKNSMSKSSSQQANALQLTAPQDAFELASVKLRDPSSDAVRNANQLSELQLMTHGCTGDLVGGARFDPGRLAMSAVTVKTLVIAAYGQDCTLVEGGPAWARSGEYYEINALLPAGTPRYTVSDLRKGEAPALQRMLQNLLADRFRLVLKRELREMSVYALTVATPGKLKLSPDETVPAPSVAGLPPLPPVGKGQNLYFVLPGEALMAGHAISVAELAKNLRPRAGRIVVDKTGFTGLIDYNLKFALETNPWIPGAPPSPQSIPPLPTATQPLPSLGDVLRDQLGLKLESARMPIEVLVIERVERPSEN